MAGRHPRGLGPRDERAHAVIKDAMAKGYVGSGEYYNCDGFSTREAANEGRKSLNNGARHLGPSCSSKESDDILALADGTWRVRFKLFPKNAGRAHIAKKSGGDPSKLAYNPFKRGEGPLIDEDGRPA